MLDLKRLERLKLRRNPWSHYVVAYGFVGPSYYFPSRVRTVIEGLENLPQDRGVFLAMNHTDRYNTWPLQNYFLHNRGPTTAAWVKGKYYENPVMARFMEITNNIPLPSRGYVLVTEFRRLSGRKPHEEEYRLLRHIVDGDALTDAANEPGMTTLSAIIGSPTAFRASFQALFSAMAAQSMRLTRQAIKELGIHVIVFPDGTRSKRIGRGLTGLAQIAQHLDATIVPIGCSGCDHVYPGNSPFPRRGTVVYRIGKPITVDDPAIRAHRVPSDVEPLSSGASELHGAQYRAITDVIMHRINDLLDPEYQFANETPTDVEKGVDRFI